MRTGSDTHITKHTAICSSYSCHHKAYSYMYHLQLSPRNIQLYVPATAVITKQTAVRTGYSCHHKTDSCTYRLQLSSQNTEGLRTGHGCLEAGVVVTGDLVADVVAAEVLVVIALSRPAHHSSVQRVHVRLVAAHDLRSARGGGVGARPVHTGHDLYTRGTTCTHGAGGLGTTCTYGARPVHTAHDLYTWGRGVGHDLWRNSVALGSDPPHPPSPQPPIF